MKQKIMFLLLLITHLYIGQVKTKVGKLYAVFPEKPSYSADYTPNGEMAKMYTVANKNIFLMGMEVKAEQNLSNQLLKMRRTASPQEIYKLEESAFSSFVKGMKTNGNITIISEKNIYLGKYRGKEYSMTMKGVPVYVKIFLIEDAFIQFQAMSINNSSIEVKKFLNSISLN